MHKWLAALAVVMLATAVGCGDNSRACGPGTVEDEGSCIPAATCGFGTAEAPETGECVPDGSTVCSNGTVFDPLTGSCKIDAAACQNGTVLIDNACVDPTGGLVITAQEGPEPNGLGFIEQSDAQAGNVTVPAIGDPAVVVHGTIDPWRDFNSDGVLEPDVDTFIVIATGPAYLRVTADGVGGTAAGFVAVAEVEAEDPLASWERVGLSLVSDTAVRAVFLPRAGRYRLAVADTRTLLEYVTTGNPKAAPGGDTSEYYVSITQEVVPTAIGLPVANNTASITTSLASDQIAVYSVPMGTGLNAVTLAMPSGLANAAFVVLRNNDLAGEAVEPSNGPARAVVGDVLPAELTRIFVDQSYTLIPSAVTFSLDVTISTSVPLSTTGAAVVTPATTNVGTEFSRLNLFSFDVAMHDETLGMELAWSPPIVGEIYDPTGVRIASFTPPATTVTWSSYRGIVRVARAGRYYFAVYAPTATSASSLSVTSTITPLTPAAVAPGTPLTSVPVNGFRSVPFTYEPGPAPWQQFDVTGVSTGGQTAAWYEPAVAYGRLDALTTSAGPVASEVPPIFTAPYAAGGGPIGRVLLGDGTPSYFVKVNAVSPTGSPTVSLDFTTRAAASDLGTLLTGSATRTGETLDPTTPQRFYLVRTTVGATVSITVTPTSNVNTQFRRLAADETPLGALINTSTNGADLETFTQSGSEWTAFVVSSAGNLSGSRTFDVAVSIQ